MLSGLQVCYIRRVMKRFGFSLDQELHAALKERADEEGTSMAAICREALMLHLQKPALDVPLPPRPNTTSSSWMRLKDEVTGYLNGFKDSFESFLPRATFHPDHTPDLMCRTGEPGRETPSAQYYVEYPDTRWLDEIWA